MAATSRCRRKWTCARAAPAANGKLDAKLVDIRSPDEYSGKVVAPQGFTELAVRAGHIPGAVNVPWGRAVNADGTFKSVPELKALYAGVMSGESFVCRD